MQQCVKKAETCECIQMLLENLGEVCLFCHNTLEVISDLSGNVTMNGDRQRIAFGMWIVRDPRGRLDAYSESDFVQAFSTRN